MFRDVISGTKFKFKCFSLLKYDHQLACIRILIYYIILKKLFYIHLKMNFLHYTVQYEIKKLSLCKYLSIFATYGRTYNLCSLVLFFQTKKQRRVFVCNSSAAVRPAVIRHGARTRSQHRNFRERGQEGVSG